MSSIRRRSQNSRRASLWLLLALLVLGGGCRSPEVDSAYGKRREGGGSLNGTSVLSEMYRDHGCRVRSWSRLSPKLDSADVIVWFPDDFEPPGGDQRRYLEDWLYQGQRTLVYVGRDFDASPLYWKRIAEGAPPGQLQELLRREALARSLHDNRRSAIKDNYDAEWFTSHRGGPRRKVESLEGPWSDHLDAQAADIHLQSTLVPPSPASATNRGGYAGSEIEVEVLLEAEGDPLVYRLRSTDWYGSQILVVANGSLVLNMPLVNKENRKLAGLLVEASLPAQDVVFLETEAGGPTVFNFEPQGQGRSGWEWWSAFLMHLAAMGVLYCFSRFAIFGRPRTLPSAKLSDFGHHVTALGRLVEHTGDTEYARARLRHYNQTARRDSGASHVKPKKRFGSE